MNWLSWVDWCSVKVAQHRTKVWGFFIERCLFQSPPLEIQVFVLWIFRVEWLSGYPLRIQVRPKKGITPIQSYSGDQIETINPAPLEAFRIEHQEAQDTIGRSAKNTWATKKQTNSDLSMKYWLFNTDPYFMVYELIPAQHNRVGFHPLGPIYTLNNQDVFHWSPGVQPPTKEIETAESHLWHEGILGCPRKLGSMLSKWVISYL